MLWGGENLRRLQLQLLPVVGILPDLLALSLSCCDSAGRHGPVRSGSTGPDASWVRRHGAGAGS
jgi:hypothetical protein